MTTWTESIKQTPIFIDSDSMAGMGRSVPVSLPSGKLPYCVYQKPSKDGNVKGVRCGIADGKR